MRKIFRKLETNNRTMAVVKAIAKASSTSEIRDLVSFSGNPFMI